MTASSPLRIDPIRDEFVLHLHTRRCRCGRVERSSHLYVVTEYADLRRLTPTKCRPLYRPHVVILPTEFIPMCEHCYSVLPERPASLAPSPSRPRARWRDASATPSAKPKKVTTLLDLA